MGVADVHIQVAGLTMAFGTRVIQKDLDFVVNRGDVFVIMGGSGCGKSTLLKHMIGLMEPASGEILYDGQSYQRATARSGTGCASAGVSPIRRGACSAP